MNPSGGADAPLRFFAAAARGTEPALVNELTRLEVSGVPGSGGVAFEGALSQAYKVCVWSRIATRVTLELDRSEVESADAHYAWVRSLTWEDHLDPHRTFAVAVSGRHSGMRNSRYAALRTKDGIVDRFRDRTGGRPNVDTDHPDVRVHVTLGSPVIVSVELAGGMHQRGYRPHQARAPLRESLAAALLELAGWEGSVPLVDPMCGSGTLAIEAGLRALRIAPGLLRDRGGPRAWLGHHPEQWSAIIEDAETVRRDRAKTACAPIVASDVIYETVQGARDAVKQLGLTGTVAVGRSPLVDAKPFGDTAGMVITNPPYGERIGTERELIPLYQMLGDVLKRRFGGWKAWVLSGSGELAKHIGLSAASRHTVFNGAIECRFLEFEIRSKKTFTDTGPGWRKPSPESEMFKNRFEKNLRRLRPWATSERITAFRAYNRDIPEYNVAVDVYGGRVRVEEFAPPKSVAAGVADRRLQDVMLTVATVLDVAPERIVLRVRAPREGHEQDGRRGDSGHRFAIEERGIRFLVNIDDYLDTGLFLDDRTLRARLQKEAAAKRVLNLFAYTCSASVAAAVGGAAHTTSVDRSARSLEWGRANFRENDLSLDKHRFVAGDVLEWLRAAKREGERFDLVYCSPPTYSRSKEAAEFDVERDHPALIATIGDVLSEGGVLYFATNKRNFELGTLESHWSSQALGRKTIPRDFAGTEPHRAFRLTRRT